jgi:hypothetical protein
MAQSSPELWTLRVRYGSRKSIVSSSLCILMKWGSSNPLEQARASAFAISRFDPFRPSQPFRRSARLPRKCEIGPEMPAFRAFDLVSRLPNRQSQSSNRRKSSATPANIPVSQRLSAETGFDHDCRSRAAVKLAVVSSSGRTALGAFSPVLPPEGSVRFPH